MRVVGFVLGFTLLLSSVIAPQAGGLSVTLDSGSGSVTLNDDDFDGVVDFNQTVGGVFEARGRVFEQINAQSRLISITSAPPFSEAVFRNVGVIDATFMVIAVGTASTVVGPPLGWSVFYNGSADDAAAGPVNIPSHSVAATVNNGSVSLATLVGTAITVADEIDLSVAGVNASTAASDVRVVWAFTAGPNDEIRLPDNNSVDGKAIQVNIFNQEFKCVDKMNNFSRKVADKAQKSDAKCVTNGVKLGGADETTCVNDQTDAKTEKAESKLIEQFDTFCAPNPPSWGVNSGRCCEGGADGNACVIDATCAGGSCTQGACISGAAEDAANAVTHDLFGTNVVVTDGDATGKCQKKVIKFAGKLLVEHWKVFRKCKKDNFNAISNSTELVTTCLGPPQTDPRGKLGKREAKLADAVSSKCIDKGVSPVGAAFPGECGAVADNAIADCMSNRVRCRFCQGINVADDIDPPLNCDLFDDELANASCP